MRSFFEYLQSETQAARDSFLGIEQLQRGARGDISLHTYTAFLVQAYHHVKHTVPLLMACGSRIPMEKEWLREAIAEYIREETGHQEWILNDITACGGDAAACRYGKPAPETELMLAYAYDTIHRGNPIGFFGMVLVLEGTSIRLASNAAGAIQEALALPDTAFSYLTSHGSLDISHMKYFESLMNRLDDEADQQAITHVANMMYRLYGGIFRSLPLDS
ncbi:MAG: iron-containing redox enzyme family protein [Gammaproteobacteria bacterium]|jgi:pyrroloquinoline quinone (PQQ) biosynthesis protein C